MYCDNVRTVYPTLTYPIHTSLITGCYPDTHGVGHNQPFQPDTPPDMRAWYWTLADIRVKTLHQAAAEKGMDVASILWPVTGTNRFIRRNFPEVLPLPGENAAVKMVRYASPVWLLRMEALYGRQRASIRQPHLDDYAALLCEKLYASRRPPEVLTVHLVDCDAMRHQYGVDSPQAHQAMERLGDRVARIVRAVQRAGLERDTLFCVVSDHGQQDAPRGTPLDRYLQAACGARAQSLGMGAYIFGDDLAAARRAIEVHREAWGVARVFDGPALRAMRAPGHVALAVDALPGCCCVAREEETFGEHGFALDCPQARTLLWLCGPGVKRGLKLTEANVVDIAPTLAKALGVHLPDAQGRALTEVFCD